MNIEYILIWRKSLTIFFRSITKHIHAEQQKLVKLIRVITQILNNKQSLLYLHKFLQT